MPRSRSLTPAFVAGVALLMLGIGAAAAGEIPFPFAASDPAAARARYAGWTPSARTMQMLEKAELPRYLDVVPASEGYEAAMNRFSRVLRANRQHSGTMLADIVAPAESAKRIDLAFVIEGFRMPVPAGMERLQQYGLVPLTLGQCTELLGSQPKLAAAIKANLVPMPQRAGTQLEEGLQSAVAQAFVGKDGSWTVGRLTQTGPNDRWPMAIFAGPR